MDAGDGSDSESESDRGGSCDGLCTRLLRVPLVLTMPIVAMVPKLPFVPLVLTMPIVAMVPKLPFVPLVLTICTRARTRVRRYARMHTGGGTQGFEDTPNLPTKIIPAKIRCLRLTGKSPTDLRIPPHEVKILLESNPLKSGILVRRLAVFYDQRGARRPYIYIYIYIYHILVLRLAVASQRRGQSEDEGRKRAVFAYIYIYIYMYMCIYIYIYICLCMHIYIYIYIYVSLSLPLSLSIYIYI